MGIGKLLKPERKKFVLPAIFIIVFLFMASAPAYSWGPALDKYACEYLSLWQEATTNAEKNDTYALNKTLEKMSALSGNWQKENEKQGLTMTLPLQYFSAAFLKTINPVTPVPCEYSAGGSMIYNPSMANDFCVFYISRDSYDCTEGLRKLLSPVKIPVNITGQTEQTERKEEYRQASAVTLGANILILFAEGYLLSSVILFIYRKKRILGLLAAAAFMELVIAGGIIAVGGVANLLNPGFIFILVLLAAALVVFSLILSFIINRFTGKGKKGGIPELEPDASRRHKFLSNPGQ
jgi:ABC-type multidrug transport system fused ATPase/permease subunit